MASRLLQNASRFLNILTLLDTGQAYDVRFHLHRVGYYLNLSFCKQVLLKIQSIVKVGEADWAIRHDDVITLSVADDYHALLLLIDLPLDRCNILLLVRAEPTQLL